MHASSLRRRTRSPCLRGKNPSKKKCSQEIPLATKAVTQAEGPGITCTSTPASRAASTRTWPGSETLGMPASEANAKVSPASKRSTSSGARWTITFSSQRMSVLDIPRCAKSLDVTRVSSQQMASAARKASATRGLISPRLPMGVPTIYRHPLIRCATSSLYRQSIIARSSGASATRASHAGMRFSVFHAWKYQPHAVSKLASWLDTNTRS